MAGPVVYCSLHTAVLGLPGVCRIHGEPGVGLSHFLLHCTDFNVLSGIPTTVMIRLAMIITRRLLPVQETQSKLINHNIINNSLIIHNKYSNMRNIVNSRVMKDKFRIRIHLSSRWLTPSSLLIRINNPHQKCRSQRSLLLRPLCSILPRSEPEVLRHSSTLRHFPAFQSSRGRIPCQGRDQFNPPQVGRTLKLEADKRRSQRRFLLQLLILIMALSKLYHPLHLPKTSLPQCLQSL